MTAAIPPGAPVRTERAWQAFSRRFGLLITNPLRFMAGAIVPVVVAASADFTDSERPLYGGGIGSAGFAGAFTSIGLRANVATNVQAFYAETVGFLSVFTQPDAEVYDPVAVGLVTTSADIQPGGVAENRILSGRNAVQKPGQTLAYSAAAGSNPLTFVDLILEPGSELWVQGAALDQAVRVNYFWRELTFG